ncbi:unnamed protein product [marine sediment metagenome]|uniref:Uncharacterized protein n=1 Tax=marine sediment metagenome TaxID=412755 RepID=X1GQ15_9ZZZZ
MHKVQIPNAISGDISHWFGSQSLSCQLSVSIGDENDFVRLITSCHIWRLRGND